MVSPRENDFDTFVVAESAATGVPVPAIKAIMATENAEFDPSAFRNEPQINDGSRGLMQVLYKTAVGFGFAGDADELFDPQTNIHYGVADFRDALDRTDGDLAGAASAYNGGYRPAKGFGVRATVALTVCLAHDQTTGECIDEHHVNPGEFANQAYVDRFLNYLTYFSQATGTDSDSVQAQAAATASKDRGSALLWTVVTVAVLGVVAVLLGVFA